ncbi:MAG: SDR family NAD(P)-dependent oxidoreductase [Chloroflexi bacterium]|nr:SDR family NAD(P)-dependent oxidoreductase [Chloroflexota bacterium]
MTNPDFTLKGKIAIITGSSRGIGKAIALAYAEAGADIAICSRTQEDLEPVAAEIRALGRHVLAVTCNVAVKADVDNMVNKTIEEFGTIDILVNNAGMNIMVPLLDLREDGWDKVINNNLKSVYLCSQAVSKVMMEKKKGNIINLTSVAGRFPIYQLGAYSIAKAGVVMLTRVLSSELAPHGIRVNAIGPGVINTDLGEPLMSSPAISMLISFGVPMGRIGETNEITGAALFLASDASTYVSGQILYIDGGVPA